MSKIRSFLLAILVVFTSLFGTACESDEEQEEPPQVRQEVDSGVQGGEQGGEEAPLDQEAGDVVEEAGESDVSGEEVSAGEIPESCGSAESDSEELGCVEPEVDPACEQEEAEESEEDCDDNVDPSEEEIPQS
tara:strand:+ start:1133 stop:1531 length:399 start_codon:yes stop_codon:yes gene_type:complete